MNPLFEALADLAINVTGFVVRTIASAAGDEAHKRAALGRLQGELPLVVARVLAVEIRDLPDPGPTAPV